MAVELVILVGIQASGKTTFYRRCMEGRYLHVSLDNWRGRGRVRNKEYRAIMDGLRASADSGGAVLGVAVDNTNVTAATRSRYFGYASEFALSAGARPRVIAYFFDEDLASCLGRNEQRPREAPAGTPYHVPPSALHDFHARLEPPRYEEGFDVIHRVAIDASGQFIVQEVPRPAG